VDLVENLLQALLVRFIGFDPAAFVANDVLMGEFWDSLDLLHRWMLQDRLLRLLVKLHVQTNLFERIDPRVQLVPDLWDCATAASSQLANTLKRFLTAARFQEWPDLLRFLLNGKASILNVELNNLDHRVVARVSVVAASSAGTRVKVIRLHLNLICWLVRLIEPAALTMELVLVIRFVARWSLLFIYLTRTVLVEYIEWVANLRIPIRTFLVVSRSLPQILDHVPMWQIQLKFLLQMVASAVLLYVSLEVALMEAQGIQFLNVWW
jgi:hypothetical protein